MLQGHLQDKTLPRRLSGVARNPEGFQEEGVASLEAKRQEGCWRPCAFPVSSSVLCCHLESKVTN